MKQHYHLYNRYENFKIMLHKHEIKISRYQLSKHCTRPANGKDITFVKPFRHLMWLCGEEDTLPYDYDKRWEILEKANWLDADDPYPLYKILIARRSKKARPKQTPEV